ncbi:hypothetical protein Sme01_45080 [Sphaerisporangium melleum]|uniref:Uncharacterized protein n=1 Tax=Sphaerisporangium melleum TaxID=321316 RepID=A0A917R0S8_9ACTN|nr:hypothetical protein GCM10007964_24010 [Sphaerisporangium melleum]GII72032.1 hypothetical protein Sme01_45080 [Sphaerisporangium melleum]
MDRLNHPGRQPRLAALALLGSTADGHLAGGVPTMLTALTLGASAGDEEANILSVELVQPPATETGTRWRRTTLS